MAGKPRRVTFTVAVEDIDSYWGGYIAGFTDGEGYFGIESLHKDRTFTCGFSLTLRDDDQPLLALIRAKLGNIGTMRPQKQHGKTHPAALFRVTTIAECIFLVRFFDRFPLQGKKARDYRIWKEAVLAKAAGAGPGYLRSLRAQIRQGRVYSARSDPAQSADKQLRLLGRETA